MSCEVAIDYKLGKGKQVTGRIVLGFNFVPFLPVPVLQDMMLMSLSCMELQLDQWLLTKGRSSAGRRSSMSGRYSESAGTGGSRSPGTHT